MNKEERDYVSDKLQVLVGTKVTDVKRKYGDVWIDFTDEHRKGYTLLMQTLFRMCDKEKILITDTDKYKNPDSESDDLFEWHVQGANLFDKWVAANKDKLLKGLLVKEVNVTKYGDLVITFDQNITLTVYVEVTNDTECWRFFEEGIDEEYDLVVLGNRVMGVGVDKS